MVVLNHYGCNILSAASAPVAHFWVSASREVCIDLMHGYFLVVDKPAQSFPVNCTVLQEERPAWFLYIIHSQSGEVLFV